MSNKPMAKDTAQNDNITDNSVLIRAAQNGDKEAMNTLLNTYYDYIYGVAYRMLGKKEDAEDVCQNALISICTNIKSFDVDKKFSNWIYTITLNAAREKYRKSKRYFQILGNYKTEKKIYSDVKSDNSDMSEFILHHLNKLPEKLKETLILVTYENKTHAEVAQILNCAENTISWRVHEARKILKDTMGKELSK